MSADETAPSPPPADASANASSEPPEPEAKPTKRRRWWRRLKWTVIVLAVLVVLLRIALGFALPYVVNAAASSVGMTAQYDDLSLSLTGGEATVWNLRVVPKDPEVSQGEPIFAANYLRGDISPLALLRGRLVVWRAEADTVDILVQRRADGTLPVLEMVAAQRNGEKLEETPDAEEPAALSFTPPLALDALRLSRVRARIVDVAVDPPVDMVVDLNARISQVGPDSPESEIEIDIFAPPMLEVLKIRALATAHERELDSSLTVDLFGLRPGALAGYLAQLGLQPAADRMDARMRGTLTTTAVADDDRAISAVLTLSDIVGTVDGRPEMRVGQVRFEAPYIGPEGVTAEELLIEGSRLSALRTADGGVRALGIELPVSGSESPQPAAETHAAADDPVQETTRPAEDAMSFSLARFVVRDAEARFRDEAVSPAVELAGQVSEVSVRDLAWPPSSDDATITFDANLALPGVLERLGAAGHVLAYADTPRLAIDVSAQGIAPVGAEPYLRLVGVESLLEDGAFNARIEASMSPGADGSSAISASARDIRFADGESPLVTMPEATLDGLAMRADGTLRVDRIVLRGPALDVELTSEGAVRTAGFRSLATSPVPAEGRAEPGAGEGTPAPEGGSEPALRAIDLGHLSWEGLALSLTDNSTEEGMVTRLNDVAVDVRDLRIDLVAPAESGESRAGTVSVRLSAPDLVERFEAAGTLAASAGTLEMQLDLAGNGMSLASLRPMLARSGIEPEWERLDLTGTLLARAVPQQGAALPLVDVDLQDVSLTDGDAELAGLDRLRIDQFTFDTGDLRVDAVEINRPRLVARRTAEGDIAIAGVRLTTPPQAPAAEPGEAVREPPTTAPTVVTTFPFGELVLPRLVMGGVRISGAEMGWLDETRSAAESIRLVADVTLGTLDTTAPDGAEMPFNIDVGAPGLDRLSLAGTVQLRPDAQHVVADIAAEGVDGAALAALLPPGMTLETRSGVFRLYAEAGLSPGIEAGGLGARLLLQDLDWRDAAGDASALAAMELLEVEIDRFDPAGGEIAARQVRVAGLQGTARRGADGSMTLAGIRMVAAAPAAAEAPAPAEPAEPPPDVAEVRDDAVSVRAGLGRSRSNALPRVSLETLDLHLARFTIVDESRPEAAPLVLQDVRLASVEPITLDPAQDEAGTPMRLALSGAAQPAIGSFHVDLSTQPLARSPTATVAVRIEGIDGEGVIALAPELADIVDASQLTDGRFSLDLESRAELQWREGVPDLASGIGGELLVRDIAFRNGEDGPVLLGLDELEADRVRFEPSSGGLVIGSLELRTPRGAFALDDRGFHAAGLVYLLESGAEPATAPAQEPGAGELAQATTEQTAPVTSTDPAALPPEFRIDSLRISGAEITFEDRTADPPLVAPITNLDVDVRGFSNRLAVQPGTLRFSIMASAGQVELPKPPESSGIAGAIGDVGRLLRQRDSEAQDTATLEMERRDLFAQFTSTGRVQLYPAPDGRVNVSLSGLEMLSLRGVAQTQGIEIGNGLFDAEADIRLNPDNTIDARMTPAFTSLRISEPANGPIAQYLRLPAPLDTVIVTLQDAGGTISLPVSVTLREGQLGTGEAIGAIASAVSQVIATAIVQSPMKVAGGGLSMLGIRGERGFAKQTVELAFEPGSTQLDAPSRRRLAALRDLVRGNGEAKAALRHRLGAGDLPLVSARANPTQDEARAVASRLRERRNELLERRPQLIGSARSAVAFGTPKEAESAAAELRALDVRVAELDESIDAALELLSPGADRRADRRVRTTAVSLGEQRLAAIRSILAGDDREVQARVQAGNAQFDPPSPEEAASRPSRTAGGIIEVEVVYPG